MRRRRDAKQPRQQRIHVDVVERGDLHALTERRSARHEQRTHRRQRRIVAMRTACMVRTPGAVLARQRVPALVPLAHARRDARMRAVLPETGRASYRVRVCQYVSISVVAVSYSTTMTAKENQKNNK